MGPNPSEEYLARRLEKFRTVREALECRHSRVCDGGNCYCTVGAALAALSALEAGEREAPKTGTVSVGSCPQCGGMCESQLAVVGPTGHLCCPIIGNLAKALFSNSPIDSGRAEFMLDAMGACQVIERIIAERNQLRAELAAQRKATEEARAETQRVYESNHENARLYRETAAELSRAVDALRPIAIYPGSITFGIVTAYDAKHGLNRGRI